MAASRGSFNMLFRALSNRTTVLTTNFTPRYLAYKMPSMRLSTSVPRTKAEKVKVTFHLPEGENHTVDAKVGDNLLDIIIENDVDIDGFGACEGTLACSTCHLIFQQKDYDKIPDKPVDEELDMLDLAYGLTETSRLGCQVIVTKDMNGLEVKVPGGIADARSGGL